jgi:hypothetical protein
VFCLALSPALASLSVAEEGTPSVLSRVQTVSDPELGELLRVALEQSGTTAEQLKIARTVTESYAQIKLLDRQIEQIQQRIKSTTGPAELRHELLLATAELESKRVVQLATLREAMGIVPEHAFGRRPQWRLKTWLELDAIDETVHILEHLQPFSDSGNYKSAGLKSQTEALDYIGKQLAQTEALPIRIDIHRTSDAIAFSEDLESAVIALVRKTGREMQAEVHRDEAVHATPSEFILRLDAGRPEVEVTVPGEQVRESAYADPNGLAALLVRLLAKPGRLPAQLAVLYPDSMHPQADQVAAIAQEVVRGMGIARFTQVTQRAFEPDVKTLYVGRWRSVGKSPAMEVVIRLQGEIAEVLTATGSGTGEVKEGSPARWSMSGRRITIRHSQGTTYQGYINSEGNLILGIGNEPVTFQKVE